MHINAGKEEGLEAHDNVTKHIVTLEIRRGGEITKYNWWYFVWICGTFQLFGNNLWDLNCGQEEIKCRLKPGTLAIIRCKFFSSIIYTKLYRWRYTKIIILPFVVQKYQTRLSPWGRNVGWGSLGQACWVVWKKSVMSLMICNPRPNFFRFKSRWMRRGGM